MSEKESSTPANSLPPIGLVARKVGMTRIFTDEGNAIASTVLDVSDNKVAQLRTPKVDGYSAVQTAYGRRRPQRVNKAHIGHLVKYEVDTGGALHEFRVKEAELEKFKPGLTLPATMFAVGQKVDVTGRSLGKGFAGVIKRHNFSSNRASHGNSVSHNKPGSISMAQDPGRVFPGKKLPGHMGDRRRTVQNLEVLKVDEPRSLLWVKGAVPGFNDGHVLVTLAAKNPL